MDWDALIRDEVAPLVPYAPGLRASEVRTRIGGGEVHKLSSNENPYGPVPAALDAMSAVLPHLNRYPDGSVRALRARLVRHLGVEDRFIAVGNGSNEILRVIANAVLRPGDEVVYAWPSFVVYPMVAQVMGATAVPVPLTADQTHDLDAMLAAVTERTRIVFLCNPNNPTGTYVSRDAMQRFLDALPDTVLVVLDEAYIEYVTAPDFPDGLDFFDGTRPLVVLRTFSKIYSLAALRVGYGIMPEPLIAAVNKVREPFNVNTVAQIAAHYSLDDAAEIERRRLENAAQRDRLYEAFSSLGITFFASEANFVWIHDDDAQELFDLLLAQGVIVRSFGALPALRVGVGSPEDTDATIRAFQRALTQRASSHE